MTRLSQLGTLLLVTAVAGCSAPGSPFANPAAPSANLTGSGAVTAAAWGPEIPNFNLEVVLRGASGFGLVKFRQPNDSDFVVHLDAWVRGLLPNTAYRLQRAVDTTLEQRDLLLKLLAKVSEEDRSLILLKEVEGHSVEELAQMTGMNENTIKVKLFRARQKLLKAAQRLMRKPGTAVSA